MTTQLDVAQGSRVQRLSEAGEWLLRLNDQGCSQEDVAEWLCWCDAHPENLAAFEDLQGDWRDLDALKVTTGVTSSLPVRLPWRVAAVLALAALTALFGGYYWQQLRSPMQHVASTTTNKTATLPDGSAVVLSARTLVKVDFTGPRRRLELSEGEAYFKVERDKQRPFVVHAGDIDVTAIGTAFNIRHEEGRVVVTIEEGIVEVSSSLRHSAPNTWRAEAGYQLKYSTRDRTATLARVDPAAILKWRSGELAYVWEPLASVIDDINRYSPRRLILTDTNIAALRFTGTVFTASIDDWLKAIQDVYPVRAERLPNGDIVLNPESSHSIARESQ